MVILEGLFWIFVVFAYFIPALLVIFHFFYILIYEEKKFTVGDFLVFLVFLFIAVFPVLNILYLRDHNVFEILRLNEKIEKIINYTIFEW